MRNLAAKVQGGLTYVMQNSSIRSENYALGLVLVTASAVAWSTAGLFTRLIPVDTATLLVWRGIFGAAGILIVIVALQKGSTVREFQKMGWPGWIFAIVSALGMLCFITSLRITTVAHVSIVYATVPLVAAGLAWVVMNERPGTSAMVASVIALGGVVLMVGFSAEGNIFGDLLAFGMTSALAVMMVISRRYRNIPIMPAACLSALLSGIAAVPMSSELSVSFGELGLLALFGFVNSALGLTLFTLGARMLPAIETALIGALDAPLAPIWVWILFSEIPGKSTLAGGTIVFIAVIVHIVINNRTGQPAHPK